MESEEEDGYDSMEEDEYDSMEQGGYDSTVLRRRMSKWINFTNFHLLDNLNVFSNYQFLGFC